MSSGVFRGKESSNRIELSRLVQDLFNFGVFGFLGLWGGGRWVERCLGASGGMGGCPHMHTHACTHMFTCIEIANGHDMEASMFIMFNMHVHVCVHVCVCMCMCACMEHPLHTHTHPHLHAPICHPPPPPPRSRNQSKLYNT